MNPNSPSLKTCSEPPLSALPFGLRAGRARVKTSLLLLLEITLAFARFVVFFFFSPDAKGENHPGKAGAGRGTGLRGPCCWWGRLDLGNLKLLLPCLLEGKAWTHGAREAGGEEEVPRAVTFARPPGQLI